jgi:NADP-dependent 3-hydroxy acid dehydrogenase YdfG
MAKVWLITGSGNGLGRDIAEAALAAGDSVVAGARRTEELAPLVAQYGGRVRPVTLEVRDEAAAKAAVKLAVDSFGGWTCWSTMPATGRLRRSSR